MRIDTTAEWLEADGLGGFAMGTVSGERTRRYHALLVTATEPPAGRMVLVNGLEAYVVTPDARVALTSHRYAPGVVHPDGAGRIAAFAPEPWPTWRFDLPGGLSVEQRLFVPRGRSAVVISWRLLSNAAGVRLEVRPLLSGRDYHALHRANDAFDWTARQADSGTVTWKPYEGLPPIRAAANGAFAADPLWYRNFLYTDEQSRGLDCIEDLASPGVFRFDLSAGAAWCVFQAGETPLGGPGEPFEDAVSRLGRKEARRRAAFHSPLDRAADAYVVERGAGRTIVAGYPWFTDWGRDTFIALRGLCISGQRLRDAHAILLEWSGTVSEGMLPNRFPDGGGEAEFNAVDASLWFVIATAELLEAAGRLGHRVAARDRRRLTAAADAILSGYARGTRFGIRADTDGLLACGVPGIQLTWMDARVDGRVITPRVGKPVDVQALWLNALHAAAGWSSSHGPILERGLGSFADRFWDDERGYLCDVVDVDHEPGRRDPSLRPNQVLAIGGLPLALVDRERTGRALRAIEAALLTPLGLRSLDPTAPGYVPRYIGGVSERDGAYHQGTVWPWLLGPFVEAWVRHRGSSREARRAARTRFVEPLLAHLASAGLGHVSEIADAEPPHTARGCPFQAWSLGELIRLDRTVLAEPEPAPRPRRFAAAVQPARI